MPLSEANLITEARLKGFRKDAWVQVLGQSEIRKMTSNRLNISGDNILTTGRSPFFIRYKGRWIAEVLHKSKH